MNTSKLNRPCVNIVVLNWNGKQDTLRCLSSLKELTYSNFRITVVDNGSEDDSVTAIRREHPEVELICTGANLGYAGGNNVGLRAFISDDCGDYVLLLNNDTRVDSEMVEVLVDAAEATQGLVAFGPTIRFDDGSERIWFAGANWSSSNLKFEHWKYGEVAAPGGEAHYKSDYIVGCALFISKETLKAVGLLDERYFLVYEEVEWCYRLRRLGGQCVIVERAQMWHRVAASFGGYTSPMAQYFFARNIHLWAESALPLPQRARLLVTALADVVLPILWHKDRTSTALLRRIFWALRSSSTWDPALYRERSYQSRTAALRDYVLRRFGDCPRSIRH